MKVNKKCNFCGKYHDTDKYLVPLNDKKSMSGLIWFNCSCGSTMAIWADNNNNKDN